MDEIQGILLTLTKDEKSILLHTLKRMHWGDCDYEFLDNDNTIKTVSAEVYLTNLKKENVNDIPNKRKPHIFKSIYKKFELNNHGVGKYMSHASDWWDDGDGDVLFIPSSIKKEFYTILINSF